MKNHDPQPQLLEGSSLATDIRRYFQDKARKQPKKVRTRAIILDGVVETIGQNGLARTTIREIVESAGISLGTFYNHFENRTEAILTAASSVANEILMICTVPDEFPEGEDKAIVVVTYAFMQAAIQRPSWGKTLAATVTMLDAARDPSTARLELLIDRGHANGVFRVASTPLLSMQVRAIQSLTISNAETNPRASDAVPNTCEAILRLLGRTPKEAAATVEKTLGKYF